MTAYFISGLGTDQRIFQKLSLPSRLYIVHLHWLPPQKNEPLAAYCRRMAAAIDTAEPFVLVGLSFGGMVAVELSKIVAPQFIVLISSAATRMELPPLLRVAGALGVHRMLPPALLKWHNPVANWLFGAQTKKEKRLLWGIMREASPILVQWSVAAILTWKNRHRPAGLLHLHGAADRILPVRYTHADFIIEGAGHLMVWSHAKEVSNLLSKHLAAYLK